MPKTGFLVCAFLLAGLAAWPQTVWSESQPAQPQPAAESLRDGLAVRYYFAKFNHIRELETWMKYRDGKSGKPIPMLNYNVGKGNVLTSDIDELVGAHINGYIHFEAPGTYKFKVTSNDGVRVNLGGTQIYDDPDVHRDRTSNRRRHWLLRSQPRHHKSDSYI
jgi:hypothetical protein